MLSGHTSHQVGLDVDIWFTPMPNHVQSREEREFSSATDVVAPDLLDVDPEVWTHTHTELIRTAAQDPAVARIDALVVRGYLAEEERDNGTALKKAIEAALSDIELDLQSETAERSRARV
jgi:penicillin-insensitive murein DD-endopeptidase